METGKFTLVKKLQAFSWWLVLVVIGWTLATCSGNKNERKNSESNLNSPTGENKAEVLDPKKSKSTVGKDITEEEAFPIWSVQGYSLNNTDVPNRGSSKRTINFNIAKKEKDPKKVASFGDAITQNLANKLVLEFYENFTNGIRETVDKSNLFPGTDSKTQKEKIEFTNLLIDSLSKQLIYQVSFSKDAISKILSQPDCAGIKAYYCLGLPEVGKPRVPSIILVGVDNNNKDLVHDRKNESIIYIRENNRRIKPDNVSSLVALSPQNTLIYEVGGTDNVKTYASPEVRNKFIK